MTDTTGPKVGEVWKRLGCGQFSIGRFAGIGRDYEQTKFFIFNRLFDGEAFIITKDDFFAERKRWQRGN